MVTLGEGGTVAVALGRGPMHQTPLYWCLTRDTAAVIPYHIIYDLFDTKSEKVSIDCYYHDKWGNFVK